jgi:hypothetical protein
MSAHKDEPQGGHPQPRPQPATPVAPAAAGADATRVESVIAAELEQIARRRHAHDLGEPGGEQDGSATVYEKAGNQDLVGLALSGGGIRSATFCLGVLQGLAGLTRLGPLKYLDYLSTVSGGGYIGSWFVAWVSRAPKRLKEVEHLLRPRRIDQAAPPPGNQPPHGDDQEPAPIFHLRRFSNYLAPRLGLASADVWVLWATYLRNFLVCQMVLLPAAVGVLLLARLFLVLYHPGTPEFLAGRLGISPEHFVEGAQWALAAVVVAWWFLAALVAFLGSGLVRPEGPAPPGAGPRRLRSPELVWGVVVPLVLTAVVFCCFPALRSYKAEHAGGGAGGAQVLGFVLREPVFYVLLACVLVPAVVVLIAYGAALPLHPRREDVRAHLGWTFVACAAGGALLFALLHFLVWLSQPGPGELSDYVRARAAARVATFGPPLVLGVIVLTVYFGIGLLRGRLREGLREWWSSLCARLMLVAALWMFVNLVALYATAAVIWAGPWARAALGSGWLLTVIGGVLAGGASGTDVVRPRRGPLDWLALLAPPVFVVGLLVGVSLLLHALLDTPPNWERGLDTAKWMRHDEPPHPAIRVRDTTHSFWGWPVQERQEVREHARVFDDLAVASRVYWLGMFNTDSTWVPQPKYELSPEDLRYFDEKRKLPQEVAKKLNDIRGKVKDKDVKTPEEFRDQYAKALATMPWDLREPYAGAAWKLRPADKALPGEVTQEELLEAATDAKLIKFDLGTLLAKLLLALLACGGLFLLAALRVDVNLFSLHAVYGNRLTRCYLGASHQGRAASTDPVTDLDPGDDLKLADLRAPAGAKDGGYNGPYLLVNATLNLVGGKELAWQERKAESFLFSPLWCGSADTGYCPTTEYADGPHLSTAVTISGAAASPNMGYSSSPAVTALLTVFNARLGAWLGNPAKASRGDRGPRWGFLYLLKELFGRTSSDSSYVFLSDGGHFENLGGYELVRRRCRYIVLVDADCDGRHQFENLGNLIRKCRTDFGIPIEIDLGALRRSAEGRVRWHCAVGKVHYEDVDYGAVPGTLVYLKPSLTGDEPADVLHYATQHPDFPHETTADQFFSESQFESYRALGQHVAAMTFGDALDDVQRELDLLPPGTPAGEQRRAAVRALFSSVERRWFALPPEYEASFLHSTHGYIDLHRSMADDARLRRLTLGMYPELAAALDGADGPDGAAPAARHPVQQALEVATALTNVLWPPRPEGADRPADAGDAPAVNPAGRACAEVHTLVQMLQIMENAWLSLNLDVHYAHPLNRGWMDVFYRWTNTPLFRRHWPVLRSEFARRFVSFCEKQVRMGRVKVELWPLGDLWQLQGQVPDVLAHEFSAQWPQRPGLQQRANAAACWLVYARMAGPDTADDRLPPAAEETPFGIILLGPDSPPRQGEEEAGGGYEFLIWVRGAYRNSGVGRDAALQLFQQFHDRGWPRPPFRLIVRLPVDEVTGPGGSLLRAMWETFFHHLDFHQVYRPRAAAPHGAAVAQTEELVLERRFPTRKAASAPTAPGGAHGR